uniref:UCR_hinge domain-containing protein n=1 Tax=Pristionchus pacificus TaxID=54126 RepID=A0A2A6B8T6_PRIPA|eukprot:PDM62285.1 hypothetical protein PRIPAC_51727 [Pristionchus pacificus]
MLLTTSFLLLVVHLTSQKSPNIAFDLSHLVVGEYPWDIDGPCQVYVERLSVAIGKIVQCAANFTIPPKVCTNCIEEYMDYKYVEYDTKHVTNVTSLDNTTCSDVIYRNYLLSYVNELSQSVDSRIWDISRCGDCLTPIWDYENNTKNYDYSLKVIDFKMNDTARLWNHVWNCSTAQKREKEYVPVTITAGLLVLFTVFFYLSSYIQGGGEARRFVQYSRLTDPRPARQHLLSTTASDANLSSRASRLDTSLDKSIVSSSPSPQPTRLILGRDMSHKAAPLEEGVDQLGQWRERCADHVADLKQLLDDCNDRVNSRTNTEETCHQEMVDYIHHLDDCAMPKAFAALK